jgi:hypothetical protein
VLLPDHESCIEDRTICKRCFGWDAEADQHLCSQLCLSCSGYCVWHAYACLMFTFSSPYGFHCLTRDLPLPTDPLLFKEFPTAQISIALEWRFTKISAISQISLFDEYAPGLAVARGHMLPFPRLALKLKASLMRLKWQPPRSGQRSQKKECEGERYEHLLRSCSRRTFSTQSINSLYSHHIKCL